MEVEAGDGEMRQFTSGRVLLVTDTEGRGHRDEHSWRSASVFCVGTGSVEAAQILDRSDGHGDLVKTQMCCNGAGDGLFPLLSVCQCQSHGLRLIDEPLDRIAAVK